MIIVVWLRGYLGMRVELVEKVCLDLVFVPKITDPYARFMREVLGWYSLGYVHTIAISVGYTYIDTSCYSPQIIFIKRSI